LAALGGPEEDKSLLDAARRGDATAVRALLDKGADVNAHDEDDQTALDLAKNADIRDLLLMPPRASMKDFELPQKVIGAVKSWPGVADRTLVAYAIPGSSSDTADGIGTFDLAVLVFKTSTGELMRRFKSSVDSGGLTSDMWMSRLRISLDTANYALGPGNRAFGVRVYLDASSSCSANMDETLYLFEIRGQNLKQIAIIPTYAKAIIHPCTTPCDVAQTESKATIQVAGTSNQGHADLVLHEVTLEPGRREPAANGSASSPAERKPASDDGDECDDDRPLKQSNHTQTLHFDEKQGEYR
jgi:hypothetical protein